MDFDPKAYLELASMLNAEAIKTRGLEAHYRSSVSRAYYAAVCFARNFAEDTWDNFKWDYESFHKDVREWYKTQGNGKVFNALEDLRKWRNNCDYNRKSIKEDNLKVTSSNALIAAKEVFDNCSLTAPNP